MDEAEKQRFDKAIGALNDYQAEGKIPLDAKALARIVQQESDRGLVIIIGTFIDDTLFERIVRELPKGAESRRALKKGGPLRNFEQRIAMGRALGIIDDVDARSLDVFRTMRNACSHCRQDISFKTPEMRRVLALQWDGEAAEDIVSGKTPMPARNFFILAAAYLLCILRGLSDDDARDVLVALVDSTTAGEGLRLAEMLLESLQQKPTDKRAPNPPRPAKGKGR